MRIAHLREAVVAGELVRRYVDARVIGGFAVADPEGRRVFQACGVGREDSRARWVDFERASAIPSETITISYDSYRNLVARGIIATPIAPRHPQPFPGFVPDPA